MPAHDSEYIISHGKHIAYSDTENGTYVTIEDTREISFPEAELGSAETTNDSTPDFRKDYIPGLYEPGTISFTYVYGKTQFAAIEALFQLASVAGTRNSATKYWKITLSDGSTGIVRGFLTKHTLPGSEGEDVHVCECEIQCRGKLTFAAPAVV